MTDAAAALADAASGRGLQAVDASGTELRGAVHYASARAGPATVFAEQPPETLLCPLCADVFEAPLLLPCGHAFCAACAATPTGRGTGVCPLPACARLASRPPTPKHTQLLAALPDAVRAQRVAALRIFCQYAVVPAADGWAFDAAGCRAQLSLGHREAHEAACPLARVACGLVDATSASAPSACPAVLRAADVDAHRRSCPFRMERCPRCGARVAARRMEAHDVMCCVRPCPRNCGAQVHTTALAQHAASECPETLVQCGLPDMQPVQPRGSGDATSATQNTAASLSLRCPFVCRRGDLAAHADTCDFRPVACAACGTVASQRRAAAHASHCPAELARCPAGCGALLRRGDLPLHLDAACPSRTVACDLHDFGCAARMLRADAPAHGAAAAAAHTTLLAAAVRALGTQAAASAEQVSLLRAELAAARSLAADVAAASAREAAAAAAAAAAESAALRAELDELRADVAAKAARADVAAAHAKAAAAGALALDAAAAAERAAAPNAPAAAAAAAAAASAAAAEARRVLCHVAHADDLDALGARVIAAQDAAAAAVEQLRREDLRAVAHAAREDSERNSAQVARLAAEVDALRSALYAAVLAPAEAAAAAAAVARAAASSAAPSSRPRRASAPGAAAAAPSVAAWRQRVLRSAGYTSVSRPLLPRGTRAGAAAASATAAQQQQPIPPQPQPRPRAPSTRGLQPALAEDA